MPPRKPKMIIPPNRTNKGISSSPVIQRISRTTGINRTTHDTPLFPPKRISQKTRRTNQKKPEPKRQFKGYGSKGSPKEIGLKRRKLDLKG